MKLIYHDPETEESKVSVFDKAIRETFSGKEILIASPYLSLSYLKRLDKLCDSGWKLLTDVNALFQSLNSKSSQEFLKYIESNINKIHHNNSLHAKAIISEDAVLMGSANFTDSGIMRNNELSVLFSDKEKVEELNDWFMAWWNKTVEVDVEMLKAILASMDYSKNTSKVVYSDLSSRIRSTLVIDSDKEIDYQLSESDIAILLSKWQDQEWVTSILDTIKDVLKHFSLENDDERFALTLRDMGGMPCINFTINNRYSLTPIYRKDRQRGVGIIIGLEYEIENKANNNLFQEISIKALENGFSQNNLKQAQWIEVKMDGPIIFTEKMKSMWYHAMKIELDLDHKSPVKKKHKPEIYNLVMDDLVREESFAQKNFNQK